MSISKIIKRLSFTGFLLVYGSFIDFHAVIAPLRLYIPSYIATTMFRGCFITQSEDSFMNV